MEIRFHKLWQYNKLHSKLLTMFERSTNNDDFDSEDLATAKSNIQEISDFLNTL